MGMFLAGLLMGSLLGVFVMCMVQIGRISGDGGGSVEN